jgi:hypothetical protein
MSADTTRPRVQGLIIRHDPWCPMAYGEGATCATGCSPTAELVDVGRFTEIIQRDAGNRAARRQAAKAARRAPR